MNQDLSANRLTRGHNLPVQPSNSPAFPFAAIVGQEDAKLALILALVTPRLGGVLIAGAAGTGKSTLCRSVYSILPRHNHDKSVSSGRAVPFVEIPLNVSEDRLLGGIDIESTLASGRKVFASGLLAEADSGFVFLDHLNLLSRTSVNQIAAACDLSAVIVEREGFSSRIPARFTIIATCDTADGELPAVLRDRVGLIVQAQPPQSNVERVEVVERACRFERNHQDFRSVYDEQDQALKSRISRAQAILSDVRVTREDIERLSGAALELNVAGNRADIFAIWAAQACAALCVRTHLVDDDLVTAVRVVLLPRATNNPLTRFSESEISQVAEADPPIQDQDKHRSHPGQSEPDQPSRPTSEEAGDASDPYEFRNSSQDDQVRNPTDESGSALNSSATSLIAMAISSPIPPALKTILGTSNDSAPGRRAADQIRSGRRGLTAPAQSGRYFASATTDEGHRLKKVAFDATLRAAAPLQKIRRQERSSARSIVRDKAIEQHTGNKDARSNRIAPVILKATDLRFKRFKKTKGTLFIFAVDASGSMAMGRIGQAKGTVIRLLQRSYVNRDSVSLISFGGDSANVVLPPTRSVTRARTSIELLPAGGGTPISAGILQALSVAQAARRKLPYRVILVVLTDGRANVPMSRQAEAQSATKAVRQAIISEELKQLGRVLRRDSITTVVVDTAPQFVSRGEAVSLSALLGAKYVYLPGPSSLAIYDVLKQISDEGNSKPD